MSDTNLRYKVYSGNMLIARCYHAEDAARVASATVMPIIKIGRRVVWNYAAEGVSAVQKVPPAIIYERASGGVR